MGRAKLQLELIPDEKRRRRTYRKRMNGLKKKAFELATLCDIGVGIVSFGPDGQVHTWPENRHDFSDIVSRFVRLNKAEQAKHQVDLSHCLDGKIGKLKTELAQLQGSTSKSNQDDGLGDMDLEFDSLDELLEIGELELPAATGLDELLEIGELELPAATGAVVGDGVAQSDMDLKFMFEDFISDGFDSAFMPSLENNKFPEFDEVELLQDWSSIELFADTAWM